MSGSLRSLIALTVGCAFAAAVFGFGSEIFAFRASIAGEPGRAELILSTRLVVFVVLGVLLAFKGGWPGVVAAVAMAATATTVEWALFPFSYEWALSQSPPVQQDVPASVVRPTYLTWALEDLIGVGICAAFAQGLRMFAHTDPKATPDE